MNKPLTLGSLFDGSGGFPLAGLLAGIVPVWSSEIEPFAIRVTEKRLPQVQHFDNISGTAWCKAAACGHHHLWQSMPGYEHRRKTNRSERQPFFSVSRSNPYHPRNEVCKQW